MTAGVFDLGELVKRTIKYLVEGVMVAIAAYAIPKRGLSFEEVALIALTIAAAVNWCKQAGGAKSLPTHRASTLRANCACGSYGAALGNTKRRASSRT